VLSAASCHANVVKILIPFSLVPVHALIRSSDLFPFLSFLSEDSALVEKSNSFWSDFNNVTVEWGSRHLIEAPAPTRSSSEQRSCHYWFCLRDILIQRYLFPMEGYPKAWFRQSVSVVERQNFVNRIGETKGILENRITLNCWMQSENKKEVVGLKTRF